MVGSIFRKIFGSRNDRTLKRLNKVVTKINALEPAWESLSEEALKAKTAEFRQRYQNGESLDDLLPEAFATVREASKRVMGMRHYDVQMIGGMVLHEGRIAEMRTGEGKTLVGTLPTYLNAISGDGVHVVTVNDYLAKRDAEWMSRLYNYLGLTVGVVVPGMGQEAKRQAYGCDITYGTNNEFGFDYLRDNMAMSLEDKVQRKLNFAVVDEVDSILIDEARTPLIISGPTNDSSELYIKVNQLVPELVRQQEEEGPGDYSVDEKNKQIYLTEDGHEKAEQWLVDQGLLADGQSLYEPANLVLFHHLTSAIRAHALFEKDKDYIVRDGQVIIVDEFTGRTMDGRRWSDGLHQAVEAKEGVRIQNENQTLASITFQNYFRLYEKLSGMTGTADTEAFEFQQIYGLEVVVIPTHRPVQRIDYGDLVFLTIEEKYEAIIKDIKACLARQQPVLVGTASIESSEYLSNLLRKEKISHEVLNAKQHAREADIIAQAGRPGAVTIATNMAGRGTDIVLGGNFESEIAKLENPDDPVAIEKIRKDWEQRHQIVLEAGGLHVIGTERHESRRVDNQLRGRSGRQGDPGSTRFYLSLQDSLMRIFASDRVAGLMKRLGMQHGEAIEHPWVSKSIENAQRKVEGHNFDIRKHLLEYDDVANDQRKVIYNQRDDLLAESDISEALQHIRRDVVAEVYSAHIPPGSMEEQWDVAGLEHALEHEFGQRIPVAQWLEQDESLHEENLLDKIVEVLEQDFAAKEAVVGAENMRRFEKTLMLQVQDNAWKEHLAAMDYLRQSIGLRGYAQKNPKQEYKREAFEMFGDMLDRIKHEVIAMLSRVQVQSQEQIEAAEAARRQQQEAQQMQAHHEEARGALAAEHSDSEQQAPFVREQAKVGRNDPCPCGSGKKYKLCHGKLA